MFGKALWLVFAVCLVQSTKGIPVSDILKDLLIRVEEAAETIANVTSKGENRIKDTYISIQKSLNVYEKDLMQQRIDVENVVKQATSDAKQSGKNITTCVEQVDKAAVNLAGLAFEKCRDSELLNNLIGAVANLGKLAIPISNDLTKCKSSVETEDLQECVWTVVAIAETLADELEPDIEPAVAKAKGEATKCAKEEAAKLAALISQVKNDFSDCVEKS